MSTLLATALAYAAQGIPGFVCVANGKTPATPNGFHDATTNIEQIKSWYADNPNYNWAICPHHVGWSVIDADGESGLASLAALPELPETFTVRTPSGGVHRYFVGELPTTAWAPDRKRCLGQHLDTRGVGSYVLVPPSYVIEKEKGYEGRYETITDTDIAPLPLWVADRLRQVASDNRAAVDELDDSGNVARAISHLRNLVSADRVAVINRGGDNLTYEVACEILNLGLTPATALELMLQEWYPHCTPNNIPSFVEEKVRNAATYAQNDPGAWGVPPAAEVFADLVPLAEKRSRFYFEDEAEQEQGKDPTWLIPELIPERSSVLVMGRSGAYKSFLALSMCLSIATGVAIFGAKPKTGPTFYGALEGRTNLKKARRRAWKIGHQVDSVLDFYVGTAPIIGMPGEMQEFGDEVAKRCKHPKLIVLDTLSKCMAGLNENDAGDASKFVRFCDSLVEAFGCSVIAIHHTGKDESRGARGSSAFYAGFDTVLEVKAHRASKAVEVWVRKHKDAEERETPWTFEGRAIAGSLVFFPTDPGEHRKHTEQLDTFGPGQVGATLRSLGAIGNSAGVTTYVLACSLLPQPQNQSEADRNSAVASAEHTLRRLAKTKLRGYIDGVGKAALWFLPSL